jgi:hypothetical protein
MALRYWVTGGTGNYNSTTNWSASSGGASGASVPTAADDAIWDTNSGAGTVIINVASVAKSINFTNFTGTVDFQNTLAVAGNMTLGTGMSFANTTGTAVLRVTAAATLTSNGIAFPYDFSVLTAAVTITLAGDWECQNFIHDVSTGNATFNGNNFFINGNLSNLNTNRSILGTTVFEMKGTGTLSSNFTSTGNVVQNLVFNTTGIITITGTVGHTSVINWTYTSGTIITTGSTLSLNSGTLDLDGMVWGNVFYSNTSTITHLSDFTYGGTITTLSTTSGKTLNGFSIRHTGATGGIINLIGVPGGNGRLQGTTILSFEGSGTIDTGGSGGVIGLPININTSGTYTPSTIFSINGSTFTYTSGTIDFSGVTLDLRQINQTTTFNGISSLTFNELLMGQGGNLISIVLNDTMNVNTIITQGIDSLAPAINRFSGTHPFICNEFQMKGGRYQQIELQDGLTYIINNKLWSNYPSIATIAAQYPLVKSTTNGSKVNLNLPFGADQELYYVQFQDIDALGGQTLWVFGSTQTITNCDNINTFTQPKAVGF